jgi:hypothetical protein
VGERASRVVEPVDLIEAQGGFELRRRGVKRAPEALLDGVYSAAHRGTVDAEGGGGRRDVAGGGEVDPEGVLGGDAAVALGLERGPGRAVRVAMRAGFAVRLTEPLRGSFNFGLKRRPAHSPTGSDPRRGAVPLLARDLGVSRFT